MNYHVFIVDETTFKYHLEYGFAGTGAGGDLSPFLQNHTYANPRKKADGLTSQGEMKLVGMIADVSRIRIGDKIIFYLQAKGNREGMFFGVYRAKTTAFFDENDSNNYLVDDTGKGLSFRILIEPDEIYQLGVTEHEYLDSLDGKSYPYQMCWSLIYRKLKGNRGCTMITDYEFSNLLNKLKTKNHNQSKSWLNTTYDKTGNCISLGNHYQYAGRMLSTNITNRLIHKANNRNAYEVHLQSLIMQNFDNQILGKLYNFIASNTPFDFWIGNEVSCGVGMQRIDIMTIQQNTSDVFIKIMELKCVQPYSEIITKQIPWYIKWVSEYIAPNYIQLGKKVHISPCIVALDTNNIIFHNTLNAFTPYSIHKNLDVGKIQFLPFAITNNQIIF